MPRKAKTVRALLVGMLREVDRRATLLTTRLIYGCDQSLDVIETRVTESVS
jgi:hypothetical protein